MWSGNINPNQGLDCTNGAEDLLCRGTFDRIPIQDIDSIVDERHFGLAYGSCRYHRPGVRRTGWAMGLSSKGAGTR